MGGLAASANAFTDTHVTRRSLFTSRWGAERPGKLFRLYGYAARSTLPPSIQAARHSHPRTVAGSDPLFVALRTIVVPCILAPGNRCTLGFRNASKSATTTAPTVPTA